MTHQSQLMIGELNRAESEYLAARSNHARTQFALDLAREKFKSMKSLATDVLTDQEFFQWLTDHRQTEFTALSIGDAIKVALRRHTMQSAKQSLDDPRANTFAPSATLQQIVQWLEAGGFEFQSGTPGREVNAALMRLDDIEKTPDGEYKIKNANALAERMKILRLKKRKEGE
ncbi:MAG TPA: hypothetical protein VJ746_16190 [Nitrospira sp.]|nr:hypothetical protein [Nitrospira sp.]